MVIFHSYVKLPEGKVEYQPWWVHNDFPSRCSQPLFFGEFAENRGGLARNPMLNDINHGKILLYMYNQHVYINYITYYYKLYNLQKLGDVIYHDVSPTAICVTIECFPPVCRNITPTFFHQRSGLPRRSFPCLQLCGQNSAHLVENWANPKGQRIQIAKNIKLEV